jgi:hypothetical protein
MKIDVSDVDVDLILKAEGAGKARAGLMVAIQMLTICTRVRPNDAACGRLLQEARARVAKSVGQTRSMVGKARAAARYRKGLPHDTALQ